MPISRTARAASSGVIAMRTPRASSTSALPLWPANGPVAVLGDVRARARHHQRGDGGDIERAGAVAAGAAGVDHVCAGVDHDHALAHGAGEAGQFGRGLAFHLQRDQETRRSRCSLAPPSSSTLMASMRFVGA